VQKARLQFWSPFRCDGTEAEGEIYATLAVVGCTKECEHSCYFFLLFQLVIIMGKGQVLGIGMHR
jgi:hypothetical protein